MTNTDDVVPPARLFKYLGALPPDGDSTRERHRRPIVDSQVYFARPSDLNDPFEFLPSWVFDARSEDVEMYVSRSAPLRTTGMKAEEAAAAIQHARACVVDPLFWREEWRKQANNYGVYSMSIVPVHPLMWAHYGGSHKGYCLEFNFSDLAFVEKNPAFLPLRVTYSHQRAMQRTSIWLGAMSAGSGARPDMDKLFCHKDDNWSYEQEWRLIERRGDSGTFAYPPRLLTAVILGSRCSKDDERQLREWLSTLSHRPAIRRVVESDNDFSLTVVDA